MAAVVRHTSEHYDASPSAWKLRREAEEGKVLRLRPGSYLMTQDEEHRNIPATRIHVAKIVSTVSELSTGVIARHSAALLHGLPIPYAMIPDRVIVHHPSGGHRSKWVHSYKMRHPPSEVVDLYGCRVTSLERTVRDLVRVLDLRDGLSVLDAAMRMGLGPDAIDTSAKSATRLRNLLPIASARSESPLESRSRFLIHDLGLPMPLEQVTVLDEFGNFVARVDFWWPELGLIGEADGAVKYTTLLRPGQKAEDVIKDERSREKSLQRLGTHVIRWGWSDTKNSAKFGRMLENGMHIASQMPKPRGEYLLAKVAPLEPVDHSVQFEAVRFRKSGAAAPSRA
ncbi:MAG: hypothetical protein ACTHXA_03445 [Gulosibacter sp.]|uniref:hypothetical protein n=1 Tax=Gulosibacter sp. TaxID=2817531 RepID=UPI003F9127F9